MEIYQQIKSVCELVQKHDNRLCDLEAAHQVELLWRNRLIGAGVAITFLMPLLTALLIRILG